MARPMKEWYGAMEENRKSRWGLEAAYFRLWELWPLGFQNSLSEPGLAMNADSGDDFVQVRL